jgi:hypothetical protein
VVSTQFDADKPALNEGLPGSHQTQPRKQALTKKILAGYGSVADDELRLYRGDPQQ